jgi:hypothetical protein
MSYKETSSVSDLFPLDTLRLITGCIELRLKFVEVFAQRRAVPVLGPRVVVVSEVAASAAAGFQPVDECLSWHFGDAGPFGNLHPRDQFVAAILRSKNRSLALFRVLPIFAKRGNEIPLVRN